MPGHTSFSEQFKFSAWESSSQTADKLSLTLPNNCFSQLKKKDANKPTIHTTTKKKKKPNPEEHNI